MKKAGKQVFKFILNNFNKKQKVIFLCGPGNNGGDGFIAAKYLIKHGYSVQVYTFSDTKNYTGDALRALEEFGGISKKIDLVEH